MSFSPSIHTTHVQQEVVQVEVGVSVVPSKRGHLRSVEYDAPAKLSTEDARSMRGVSRGMPIVPPSMERLYASDRSGSFFVI